MEPFVDGDQGYSTHENLYKAMKWMAKKVDIHYLKKLERDARVEVDLEIAALERHLQRIDVGSSSVRGDAHPVASRRKTHALRSPRTT